jgi:hypothetical protein
MAKKLLIRGGYYAGSEVTGLQNIRFLILTHCPTIAIDNQASQVCSADGVACSKPLASKVETTGKSAGSHAVKVNPYTLQSIIQTEIAAYCTPERDIFAVQFGIAKPPLKCNGNASESNS